MIKLGSDSCNTITTLTTGWKEWGRSCGEFCPNPGPKTVSSRCSIQLTREHPVVLSRESPCPQLHTQPNHIHLDRHRPSTKNSVLCVRNHMHDWMRFSYSQAKRWGSPRRRSPSHRLSHPLLARGVGSHRRYGHSPFINYQLPAGVPRLCVCPGHFRNPDMWSTTLALEAADLIGVVGAVTPPHFPQLPQVLWRPALGRQGFDLDAEHAGLRC